MANRIEKQRGKYSIVIKRKVPRAGSPIKDDTGSKAFTLCMSENEKQVVMTKDFLAEPNKEDMLDAFLLARETALELGKGLFVDKNISDKLNAVNFILMPNSDKQIPLTFSEIEKLGDTPITISLDGIKHDLDGEKFHPHIKYYNGLHRINRVGATVKTSYLSVYHINLPKDKNIKIIFPNDFEQISDSIMPTCEFMQSLTFNIENDDWSKVEFINNKDSKGGKYAIVTKLNEENKDSFAFPKRVDSDYILAIEASFNKDHVYYTLPDYDKIDEYIKKNFNNPDSLIISSPKFSVINMVNMIRVLTKDNKSALSHKYYNMIKKGEYDIFGRIDILYNLYKNHPEVFKYDNFSDAECIKSLTRGVKSYVEELPSYREFFEKLVQDKNDYLL